MKLKDIIDFFRRDNSAGVAKQRLQILVSHQRQNMAEEDFIPQMRQELIQVISKYVKIDAKHINVQLQRNDKHSVLELNVTMPDKAKQEEATV